MLDCQANDQQTSKQKCYYRMLQLYYNSNIANLSNMLKRCIPDIDLQNQNRYIKKNDKMWVQMNLNKIYQNASDKLQKNLLTKNTLIKNNLQTFQIQFQKLRPQLKAQIIQKSPKRNSKKKIQSRIKRRSESFRNSKKNNTIILQSLISQPSTSNKITIQRNSLTSKRTFRVRQFRKNLDQIINNTRYMQKLQRVKLQSTFTQFFFQKDANPQEQFRQIQNQPKIFNKLKAMTNIRCSFNSSQKLFSNTKIQQNKNQAFNSLIGLQIKKQNMYKPKSKCKQRRAKLFLNF